MNRKLLSWIVLALFMSMPILGHADTVTLLNGKVLHGNIIDVSDEKNTLILDIVLDNELIGAQIELHAKEIKSLTVSDKYGGLKKKELTEEEHRQNMEKVNQRFEFVRTLAKDRYTYEVRTSAQLKQQARADQLRHEAYDFEMTKIAYGLGKVLPRRRKADVNVNYNVDETIAVNEEYEDDGWEE